MLHTYPKQIALTALISLLAFTAPNAYAAPVAGTGFSLGSEGFIAIKNTEALDIKLVYENISSAAPSVVDLTAIDEAIDGQTLREKIDSCRLPAGDLYSRGKTITAEQRQALLDNRNLAPIGKTEGTGYGIAVRRANVRALPAGSGLFASADDMERDLLQVGALDPCEPVRLLHISQDRRYYYVQSATMSGWVYIADIAACKQSEWQRYSDPTSFLVVTSRGQRIKQAAETVYAQMGTRIPLIDQNDKKYTVLMPIRRGDGRLVEAETFIDKKEAFHVGYLDCTAQTVTKLAESYLGAPYGYRGLKNSEDSIGIITDIYRTLGITLPRKADELIAASRHLPPCGDIAIISGADGECHLVLAKTDAGLTVVGQTDSKQIGTYTIANGGSAK